MCRIIAHRGASGYCPENTMAAFKKALDQQADGIELDIHLSKDGVPVICHDAKLDRTSNGQGFIKDYTYKELRQLDFGSWFDPSFAQERIPALTELLDFLSPYNLLLNIEFKVGSAFYPNIEEIVINCLEQSKFKGRIILSSFDHYCLQKIKRLNPAIKTGVLYTANWIEPWRYLELLNFDALHPVYLTVTPELVKHAHEKKLEVNTYTVNDPETITKLAYIHTDGIITNYPDRALAAIGR